MQANPSRFQQLVSELRRRRVFRVAVVYAGAAFVTVQAADLLVPALNLPGWAYSFVVVLVLLGFPVAVALAWAFDVTPEGVQRTRSKAAVDRTGRRRGERAGEVVRPPSADRPRIRRAAWLVAGMLIALTGAWAMVARTGGGADAPALDSELLSVFPFRITGADPALTYLREGMVDLLAAKFTGSGGPRAVDPQTALSAARRRVAGEDDLPRAAALDLARSLGAGYTVIGAVVGSPVGLTLSATLLETGSGRTIATSSVEGSPETLSTLVDRLAAALLSLSAGEAEQRLASLTSTSLPALRAYLDGQAAVRLGQFEEAGRYFSLALEHDSAFALAALGRAAAIQWYNDPDWWQALLLAWQLRDLLSARDRVLLEAYGGPNLPEWSTFAAWIPAAERAAQALPDRAELWYWLADRLLHQGDWIGWPGAHEQAVQHFRRAVELDPAFLQPVIHLLEIAAIEGDTAAVREYAALYFQADTVSLDAIALRWVTAAALADSSTLRLLRSELERVSEGALRRVLLSSMAPNGPLVDGDAIRDELRRRSGTRNERAAALATISWYELNRGRPSRAAAALADRRALVPDQDPSIDVNVALYWDGDEAAAERAVRELEGRASAGSGAPPEEVSRSAAALCTLGQWRLWRGDLETGARLGRELRELLPGFAAEDTVTERLGSCARVLDAILLVERRDPGGRAAVEQLETFFRTGRFQAGFDQESPIILARLWEGLGEPERALDAIRLRQNRNYVFRAPVLLQEARLAAAAGERDVAIRLYQHYLRLRSDVEPVLHAEVERVRAELADLRTERS